MKNQDIAKAIVQSILHERLADSTWRDNFPEAYEKLCEHKQDMESKIEQILKNKIMTSIITRLQRISDEPFNSHTVSFMRANIDCLQKQGWTDQEIFNDMRNMEEVSPHLCEEVALRRMKTAREAATKRIENETI